MARVCGCVALGAAAGLLVFAAAGYVILVYAPDGVAAL